MRCQPSPTFPEMMSVVFLILCYHTRSWVALPDPFTLEAYSRYWWIIPFERAFFGSPSTALYRFMSLIRGIEKSPFTNHLSCR